MKHYLKHIKQFQASFITEQTACVLMLKRQNSTVAITTFANSTSSPVRGQASIIVMPCGQQVPTVILCWRLHRPTNHRTYSSDSYRAGPMEPYKEPLSR